MKKDGGPPGRYMKDMEVTQVEAGKRKAALQVNTWKKRKTPTSMHEKEKDFSKAIKKIRPPTSEGEKKWGSPRSILYMKKMEVPPGRCKKKKRGPPGRYPKNKYGPPSLKMKKMEVPQLDT